MAQTGAIVAKSMIVAILWTGHQAAVMSRPTRVTTACSCLTLTLSMVKAIVGAFLFRAIFATVIWMAIASAVEAFAIWLVAATFAFLHTAVCASPISVAVAFFAEFITNTIAIAVVQTQICFGLALNANEPSGTQTVPVAAFSTVGCTVGVASLFTASRPFPANLAKTRGIITTVTIFTVGTHRLRAVVTTITDITFAASSDTIATTMSRAAVGAHLHLASLAHEARSTHTGTIHASSMH